MGGLLFWDVDTQVDFMQPEGRLYVSGAETIVPQLAALRRTALERGIRTVASADDHRPDDPELSAHPDYVETFPPHCLHGSPGQQRIPETRLTDPLVIEPEPQPPEAIRAAVRTHPGDILLLKRRFDVFSNPNAVPVLEELAPEEIVLFGVALDVCDRFAVEGLLVRWPGLRLSVVTDAVKAIREDQGESLLRDWKERGVRLVTTAQVT